MENQLVLVDPKEYGLEEKKALELTSGLTTILTERETLKNAYIDVIDLEINEDNLGVFKELRLKIRDNRTKGIEKWHKVTKDFFLSGGRFIDSIKNKESLENERMETALLEKEKHFENLEKARLKAIHEERVGKLLPFNYEIGNVDFSAMDENMFNAIFFGAETNHKNKLEAERLAEEQRLKALRIEAEEKEKQRLELIELKKQNEIKEKQLELERIEAKKQAEIIAKQKAESDKLAAELKAKADAELKEKQRIEAENKSKLEAAKKLEKANEADQLKSFLESFPTIEIPKHLHQNEIANDILSKYWSFKAWASKQIESL